MVNLKLINLRGKNNAHHNQRTELGNNPQAHNIAEHIQNSQTGAYEALSPAHLLFAQQTCNDKDKENFDKFCQLNAMKPCSDTANRLTGHQQ